MHETATGAALLAAARDFRPRVIAQRDAIETSRRLPDDLARELAHGGFFRIFLPAAYGGLDLTPMDGIAPQNLQVQFSYFSGRIAWRPILVSRSEERRVGKECVQPCRSRWSPYH